MKNTKFILLPIILAVVVLGVSFFSFDNIETPNIILEEKSTLVDSATSESVTFQPTTVSPEDSVTYSPSIDANSEPTIPLNRVELSNLPLLNEVVTITIDARNPSLNSSLEHVVKFYLKDGWEFVNVPKSSIENFVYSDNSTIRIVTENFTVNEGKIQTFSKQIKPTLLGINYFAVGIPYGSSAQFSLVIGENRTIPTDQYWEENPDLAPWNNEPEPEICVYDDCEPEPLPPDGYQSTPDEDITEFTTDEHFNEIRIKEGLPPINNTSINNEPSSQPNSTIKVYGYVRNSASPFSASSATFISDVNFLSP